MTKLIYLIGLPASGKSYYAKQLSEQYNAKIYSSDNLREELFGDVNECNRNEELFKELGIPYRVVQICTGDIGNKQALQYDIEAWFPAQNEKKGAYREVTSCSNCTDYQAITLNTKYTNKKGEREYVHMLNNTALTDTRPIVAILENFQTKQGTIKIPKALWPYMGGVKEIKKKK